MSEQIGAAYGFGVSMGLLSFHATSGNVPETGKAIDSARKAGDRAAKAGVDFNLEALHQPPFSTFGQAPSNVTPFVVNLRGAYEGSFEAASFATGRAYRLGVAISIAEGQATAGDAARPIASNSLRKAIWLAKDLGLDTKRVTQLANYILDLEVSLADMYMGITELRGLWQSRLDAMKAPPVIQMPRKG